MESKRPFAHIPRQILTFAVVLGGIIGIILSDRFRWTAVQAFIVTLFIISGCVIIAAVGYSALRGRRARRS
jgi:hypothetical protein